LVFAGVVWGLAAHAHVPGSLHAASGVEAARAETGFAETHAPQGAAPRFAAPESADYVEIDGAKNPELIPGWATWAFAFRVIAGGSRLIPTDVLRHLSKDESALLLEAADADQRNDAACQERMLKLRPLLLTERAQVLNAKTREIQLDCRWRTLHTRDRILAALSPDGQAALIQWVESTKAGMRVSVPKRDVAHYQQPQ
jgi:hypothetical protein